MEANFYYRNMANTRFRDSMNRGESLTKFTEEMMSNINAPFCFYLMKASLIELVRIRDSFLEKGGRINCKNKDISMIIRASSAELECQIYAAFQKVDRKKIHWLATGLAYVFDAIKPHLRVTESKPEKQANKSEKDPLEVRIVSLPDRITSSTVVRDDEGDIVKTVQVETDG